MKKMLMVLSTIAFGLVLFESANAQTSASQNLTLAVSGVQKIALGAAPAAMTISNIAVANIGTDNLDPVTGSSSYSITQNQSATAKISAKMSPALASGYTLQVEVTPGKGTGAGLVTLAATDNAVVSAIPKGADLNAPITYTFSAQASAGTLASGTYVVTYTLTDN